jgi:tetratricopeptide (TPR) repeat protein
LPSALAGHRRAQRIFEEKLGAEHPYVAESLAAQAWLLVELGQPAAALPLAERAARMAEKLAPESPQLGKALARLGEAHLALGQAARAIAPLERALQLAGPQNEALFNVRAEACFSLARVLERARRDRPRALALAEEARKLYAAQGPPARRDVAQIDSWLAAHPH